MLLLLQLLIATTPASHIEAGERAMAALEYDVAADELMRAATAPDATEAERLRAHLLAGVAHRILGRDLDARINFRYVLLRAPGTTLDPDTPPKVSMFFESVRQEIDAERGSAAREPASSSPPPTEPPPAAHGGPGVAFVSGAVVAGLGGAALLGGLAGVAYAEGSLADPSRRYAERAPLMTVGRAGAAVATLGAIAVIGGGALLLLATGDDP